MNSARLIIYILGYTVTYPYYLVKEKLKGGKTPDYFVGLSFMLMGYVAFDIVESEINSLVRNPGKYISSKKD